MTDTRETIDAGCVPHTVPSERLQTVPAFGTCEGFESASMAQYVEAFCGDNAQDCAGGDERCDVWRKQCTTQPDPDPVPVPADAGSPTLGRFGATLPSSNQGRQRRRPKRPTMSPKTIQSARTMRASKVRRTQPNPTPAPKPPRSPARLP